VTKEDKIKLIQKTVEYHLLEYIKPNNKLNIFKISEKTNIDRKTVKKYLNDFFLFEVNEIENSDKNNAYKQTKIRFYRISEIPHYLK